MFIQVTISALKTNEKPRLPRDELVLYTVNGFNGENQEDRAYKRVTHYTVWFLFQTNRSKYNSER